MSKKKQKGGVYKGKKRQRGGVYKGSKRQRGGNNLAKKTKNKIIKSFNQAEAFISQLANKGKKKIKQIGGSTVYHPPRRNSIWGKRLGLGVDKFYL